MPQYAGIDVHKQSCHATVMDEHGKILKQEKFPDEGEEFERFFHGLE